MTIMGGCDTNHLPRRIYKQVLGQHGLGHPGASLSQGNMTGV